jgi:hypothetical protein
MKKESPSAFNDLSFLDVQFVAWVGSVEILLSPPHRNQSFPQFGWDYNQHHT